MEVRKTCCSCCFFWAYESKFLVLRFFIVNYKGEVISLFAQSNYFSLLITFITTACNYNKKPEHSELNIDYFSFGTQFLYVKFRFTQFV